MCISFRENQKYQKKLFAIKLHFFNFKCQHFSTHRAVLLLPNSIIQWHKISEASETPFEWKSNLTPFVKSWLEKIYGQLIGFLTKVRSHTKKNNDTEQFHLISCRNLSSIWWGRKRCESIYVFQTENVQFTAVVVVKNGNLIIWFMQQQNLILKYLHIPPQENRWLIA